MTIDQFLAKFRHFVRSERARLRKPLDADNSTIRLTSKHGATCCPITYVTERIDGRFYMPYDFREAGRLIGLGTVDAGRIANAADYRRTATPEARRIRRKMRDALRWDRPSGLKVRY